MARSSENKVRLLELFSSESCSSCPPADQWFSRLKSDAELFKSFVPVVFHVDYWNHLDWKDDFSSREMTERQRAHASSWPKPKVYTPGVVLDGQEWTDWRRVARLPQNKPQKVGVLAIEETPKSYKVSFNPTVAIGGPATFHLALLGIGLKSKITSGENAGSLLSHDFVVLDWKRAVGKRISSSLIEAEFEKPKSIKKTTSRAIIVWVEQSNRPRALQATGSYLK
jgi:hypothetical protein